MKVIAVVGHKGGVGRTTVALHVAAAASSSGTKTLLIDIDPRASMDVWLKARQAETPKILSVPASYPLESSSDAGQQLLGALKLAHQEGYSLVIIDTPQWECAAIEIAISAADYCLIVSSSSSVDLHGLQRTAVAIRQVHGKSAGILLNRVGRDQRRTMAARTELAQALRFPVLSAMLSSRAAYWTANGCGVGVTERSGVAGTEVRALWQELRQVLGMETSEHQSNQYAA